MARAHATAAAPDAEREPAPAGLEAQVAIVVPTRDEEANVAPLLREIRATPGLAGAAIVFVDDSSDSTPDRVAALAGSHGPLSLVRRERDERVGGLGGAVRTGIAATDSEWVCVMDGDLQHPPAVVPQLLDEARRTGADLVLASRFAAGGRPSGLGRARHAGSLLLIAAARLLFPRRLHGISDPLTGFFVVRRGAVDLDVLRPHGFKILLEIIVRHPALRVGEVGFEFGRRHAGESKASVRELARFVRLLWRLRLDARGRRLLRFASVGVSGLAVNTILLALLAGTGRLHYLPAAILATQGSTAWNFALSEHFVFDRQRQRFGRLRRAGLFFAMNNAALALRGPLLVLLTATFGIHYLVSNLISLVSLTVVRFLVADAFIWSPRRVRQSWWYDLHGLVSIRSDVRLPELEFFRSQPLAGAPDVDVAIGPVDARRGPSPERIVYEEGLGTLGFAVEIERGQTTRVRASKLLRHSPHVLYTNVVEPILRWRFVENGIALVHGGCIAYGDRAFLVTARTDTGKTTTLLRTMAQGECSFLSDDLTLVMPDGRVLPYPKPLTISRHTVNAIDTARLRAHERLALVLQSRVHSRSGRLFAQLIARTGLPAATINAIVQLLIPPPKYDISRLVPDVPLARGARLAGLVVIEREGGGRHDLDPQAAGRVLLENSADAFGFPPYASIESFLRHADSDDLAQVERSIVASALREVPATVLRDERREWWRPLADVVSEITGHEQQELLPALAPGP